jgi:hypothetical protein
MRDDRFRPCEIVELEDPISLINDPHSPDITPRHPLPLHAVLNDVRAHTEVLARRLESGVHARSDEQRDPIRRLYCKRDSEPIDLRASDDCDGVSFCG